MSIKDDQKIATDWIKIIISGLTAIFFAFIGIQAHYQELRDAEQTKAINIIDQVQKRNSERLSYIEAVISLHMKEPRKDTNDE